ncbi:hypothetical protein DBR23_21185 [Acidovorax sp. HMWF018]|nr:hypothetical protein DBR23_21185 [Acidovorax sp. HMWF018]
MGWWKKRTAACNGWHRGSNFAPTRKRANFHLVQPSRDGCLSSIDPEGMLNSPSGEKCVLDGSNSKRKA